MDWIPIDYNNLPVNILSGVWVLTYSKSKVKWDPSPRIIVNSYDANGKFWYESMPFKYHEPSHYAVLTTPQEN